MRGVGYKMADIGEDAPPAVIVSEPVTEPLVAASPSSVESPAETAPETADGTVEVAEPAS